MTGIATIAASPAQVRNFLMPLSSLMMVIPLSRNVAICAALCRDWNHLAVMRGESEQVKRSAEQVADAVNEIFEFERFGDVFGGALLFRPSGRLERVEGGEEDERGGGAMVDLADELVEVEAVDAGELDVGQNEIGCRFLELRERILRRLRQRHAVSLIAQDLTERFEKFLLVFDE